MVAGDVADGGDVAFYAPYGFPGRMVLTRTCRRSRRRWWRGGGARRAPLLLESLAGVGDGGGYPRRWTRASIGCEKMCVSLSKTCARIKEEERDKRARGSLVGGGVAVFAGGNGGAPGTLVDGLVALWRWRLGKK